MANVILFPEPRGRMRSLWYSKVLITLHIGVLTVHARPRNLDWTYEEQSCWGREFPNCQGFYQSPIDIRNLTTLEDPESGPLVFGQGYLVEPDAATVLNNGHTAMVSVRTKGWATVWGGPLPAGLFRLEQLHFHWGGNDSLGSEHALNGHRFPLELHMVHYNDAYGSFKQASGKEDGVLVLAAWFGLDNRKSVRMSALRPITKSLASIPNMGDVCRIKKMIRLVDLLPRNKGSYYHYMGSLTTPPCTENVLWVVYTTPQGVSSAQLKEFRRLRGNTARSNRRILLKSNYRNLQPLHHRPVYGVRRPANHDS